MNFTSIDWKTRLANKEFLLTLVPAILLLVQVCAEPFGYEWDFVLLNAQVAAIINAFFAVLMIIGVVNNPTTSGLGD